VNILQALDDPEIFQPWFKRGLLRGDSWKPWKAFLAGLFALPMSSDALELFKRHTGRTVQPATAFQEAYCIVGRRGGKSRIAALVGTYLAAFKNYDGLLVPGELGMLMILAADKSQAKNILGYIEGFFDAIPILSSMVVNRTAETIELSNGITISVHSSDFRRVRGFTLIGVIIDELAFLRDESSANPDSEVLNAVRPGLSTIPGAILLGISSPYSRKGVLWEMFRDHYAKNDSDILIWQASSPEMNSTLSQFFLLRQELRDFASYKAEFMAQFRTDRESLFSVEVIQQRITKGRFELPPIRGVLYHGFIDPSGGVSDSMVLTIAHMDKGVVIVDLIREIVPPFSPEQTTKELCIYLRMYRCSEVTGDRYAAQWCSEQFEKNNIRYRYSELNRSEIYLEFLHITMSGQVELLDNSRLVNQLIGLERRTGRGKDVIDHASNQHDDVSNSVAGAVVRAFQSSGRVLGFVEYLKEVSAGTISDPAVPAKPPASFNETLPKCGHCGSSCVVRTASVAHCNQCSQNSDLNGVAIISTFAPESCDCGAVIVSIGNIRRCQQCGTQFSSRGPQPATNGAKRSTFAGKEFSYPKQNRGTRG
jgi:hypothetical protein